MKEGCFFSCSGREKRWDLDQEIVVNPAKKKCITLVSRHQSPNNDSLIYIQSYNKHKHFATRKADKQHKKAFSSTKMKDNNDSSFISQKDRSKQFLLICNPEANINQALDNTLNLTNISKKTVIFLQQDAPLGHSLLYKNSGRNKESSLFRGAKTIVKKLQSFQDFSSLDTDFTVNKFSLKTADKCQGQSQKFIKQYSNQQKSIRLGKLLGKGKYTHVYIVRDNITGLLMSFKEIFKPKYLSTKIVEQIINRCSRLASIKHDNLVNLHFCSENTENIIIMQEYFPNWLQNQCNININVIRVFLKQMIDAISFLHDNGLSHGQINLKHISNLLQSFKLRMSYARLLDEKQELNYLKDIYDLALTTFKIANQPKLPSTVKKSQDKPLQYHQILSQLLNSTSFESNEHKNLNNLLRQLLTSTQNIPLHPQKYLHHPFFCQY